MKRFFEFKNITPTEADLFIYGEIVQEKSVDWWTGEESQTETGLMDFKKELDNLGSIQKLNIYINSPGGDVFTASTMISMLERQKEKGTEINAYVDGLSASAASFLMFAADHIYLYKNSIVMVHKPMSWAVGNANDMQKTIDSLNKIEDSVMIPMYLSKAKCDEAKIKELIDAETWLSSTEMQEYFEVTVLNEEKVAVASISSKLFARYKNVPDFIKDFLDIQNKVTFVSKKELTGPMTVNKITFSLDNSGLSLKNEEILEKNEEKEKKIKIKLDLIKNKLKLEGLKDDFTSNC